MNTMSRTQTPKGKHVCRGYRPANIRGAPFAGSIAHRLARYKRRLSHMQISAEEGQRRHSSAGATPFTSSHLSDSFTRQARLPQHPSAAPQGGYGAGGSWAAVLGRLSTGLHSLQSNRQDRSDYCTSCPQCANVASALLTVCAKCSRRCMCHDSGSTGLVADSSACVGAQTSSVAAMRCRRHP